MPSYPLARGIMYFTLDRPFAEIESSITQEPLELPISQTWQYILALFCHGILGTCILFVMEVLRFLRLRLAVLQVVFIYLIFYRKQSKTPQSQYSLLNNDDNIGDSDVSAERTRVQNGELQDCPLLLNDLTKVYCSYDIKCRKKKIHKKTRVAVSHLSIGLQKAEVSYQVLHC